MAEDLTVEQLSAALNNSFVAIASYQSIIDDLTQKLSDANAAIASEQSNNNTLQLQMKAALEPLEVPGQT